MAAFQLPLRPTTAAMKSHAATNAVRYAWRAEQIEDGRPSDEAAVRFGVLAALPALRVVDARGLADHGHPQAEYHRSVAYLAGLNFWSPTHLPIGASARPDCGAKRT
jgi:hypothetical protein